MTGLASEYWDLDSALADAENVSVQFETDFARLGFLDASLPDHADLPAGSRSELPMWLAKALVERRSAKAFAPPYLSKRMRNLLESQAREMDLRSLCPYYFEVAQAINLMTGIVDQKTIDSLLFIMLERDKEIMNQAQHSETDDVSKFVAKLTQAELQIYQAAFETAREIELWRKSELRKLESEHSLSKRRRRI